MATFNEMRKWSFCFLCDSNLCETLHSRTKPKNLWWLLENFGQGRFNLFVGTRPNDDDDDDDADDDDDGDKDDYNDEDDDNDDVDDDGL